VDEVMKNFLFYRESNDFTDILTDANIKKNIKTKISFSQYLILGFNNYDKNVDKIVSYIMLKYVEDVADFTDVIPDRTPIPYKDYVPERKNKSLH
jgi:hypothetical protein